DTTTPAGKMVFTFLAAVAEFERELIRERVKAGIKAARDKGRKMGRPKVEANGSEVARLRAQGFSWASVCQKTGLSKGTAQRAIRGKI
ncbi:MAG: recombinase family protein, partial [Patescibacteria group bacterium]|nr:recombinase family protein [Patescibacteria group bacterium]